MEAELQDCAPCQADTQGWQKEAFSGPCWSPSGEEVERREKEGQGSQGMVTVVFGELVGGERKDKKRE